MLNTRMRVFIVAAGVGAAALGVAAPAGADPADDPCQLAVTFLCRFMPIAPGLDHDIDLTQGGGTLNGQSLPEMPDAGPIANDERPTAICPDGCA
ncbi:MAG: hypothetical protein JWR13_1047 [Mycobacterium sp.]|jgi:hypothetical protein|nr:hypothetical protein [Mycobacterium sp.]MDT5312357.1 hypothetical protein [Mycobacterium sp.]